MEASEELHVQVHRHGLLIRMNSLGPVGKSKFIVPGWVDKVGLSYRPGRLLRPACGYDNPMPESTISPIQVLWIWLQAAWAETPKAGLGCCWLCWAGHPSWAGMGWAGSGGRAGSGLALLGWAPRLGWAGLGEAGLGWEEHWAGQRGAYWGNSDTIQLLWDFQELPVCVGLRDSEELLPFGETPETFPMGFLGISWMISLRRPPETKLERMLRNSLRQFIGGFWGTQWDSLLGDSEVLVETALEGCSGEGQDSEKMRNSLRRIYRNS